MRARFVLLACTASALAATGCHQNKLEIRVEKVMGVSSTRLDPASSLGRQLDAAIGTLGGLVRHLDETDAAMDDFVAGFPSEDKAVAEVAVEKYRTVVAYIQQKAAGLLSDCRAYFDQASIAESQPDVRFTLRRVNAFLEESGEVLESWQSALRSTSAFAKLAPSPKSQAALERVFALWSEAQQAAGHARRLEPGFGGFMATDVYAITPSDPMYEKILAAESRLAPEPLTFAEVTIAGDSSIMLVMEHPGQFRVYQVSNDPSQLVRNIGFVVSKATAAVARFAAMIP